jgi:hypothetical protein
MAAIDLKKATLKIKDGTGTPKTLTVKIGEGNLTYSEKRNNEYILDRGVLSDVKQGDEVPMEVSFDFMWEYILGSSSTAPSVEEALKGASRIGWISTDSDACRPYAVDLELEYLPTPSTCGDQEVITFPDFRWESLEHDLRGASISCSGKCNATQASSVRTPQST